MTEARQPMGATVADLQGVLPVATVKRLYDLLTLAAGSSNAALLQWEPGHRETTSVVTSCAQWIMAHGALQTFLDELQAAAPDLDWAGLIRDAGTLAGPTLRGERPGWPLAMPGVDPTIPPAFTKD